MYPRPKHSFKLKYNVTKESSGVKCLRGCVGTAETACYGDESDIAAVGPVYVFSYFLPTLGKYSNAGRLTEVQIRNKFSVGVYAKAEGGLAIVQRLWYGV